MRFSVVSGLVDFYWEKCIGNLTLACHPDSRDLLAIPRQYCSKDTYSQPLHKWLLNTNASVKDTPSSRKPCCSEHLKKWLKNQWTSQIWITLTGGIGADIDDLALGSVDLVLIRSWQLGLHHDGVLCPWLQWQDEMTGFHLLFVPFCGSTWRVHIGYHPAVRAAGILSIKLGYVLKRSVRMDEKKKDG